MPRLKRLRRFDEWDSESTTIPPSIKDHLAGHSLLNHDLHGTISPVLNRCVETSGVILFFFLACKILGVIVINNVLSVTMRSSKLEVLHWN